MTCKILIDFIPLGTLSQLCPLGVGNARCFTLLQKQNIRDHIRAGVPSKGIVRKPDRAQKVCPFRKILSCRRVLLIHRTRRCNHRHYTAGTHLVNGFGKKIIVYLEMVLVILLIRNAVIAEGNIADHDIKEVIGVCRFLESVNGYGGIGIKLLCNPSRDAVQLHTVKTAFLHFLRQKSEKVAHAHRRLQDVTALKAHVRKSFIHCPDDRGRGIMCVERRASCGGIFFGRKRFVKLDKFVCPRFLLLVKGIRKAAPANIFGKSDLLLRRCLSAVKLQFL